MPDTVPQTTGRWQGGCLLCGLLSALMAGTGLAAGWRGDGTGRFAEANPPLHWSNTNHVVWKTKLPRWSNGSPLVQDNRVFVSAEPNLLLCVDAKDGAILWQRTNVCAEVLAPEECNTFDFRKAARPHDVNGFTTASPAGDGRNVYVVLANGLVVAYDAQGNRQWARAVELPTMGYGHSASPLVVGDKLIVHINSVIAFDRLSGRTAWKAPSHPRFGSPVYGRFGSVDTVVTAGGDVIRLEDGMRLRSNTVDLIYNSAVVNGDVAYFIQAGGGAVQWAPGEGDTLKPKCLWWGIRSQPDRYYYASPLWHEGIVYAVLQQALLLAFDAADGKPIYSQDLALGPGTASPSLAMAGRYLFVSSDNGGTVVVEPGREYREVARNTLEPFRSSPVFVGNRLYIRGLEHLYCIE